jgi:hypothetical protein
MRIPSAASAVLLAAVLLACNERDPPPPAKNDAGAPPLKERWKEIETPVKVGVHVPCTQLLSADKISAALTKKMDLLDVSSYDPESTAVCRVMTTGKRPSASEQDAKFKSNDRNLGVLPGDELCTAEFHCWGQYKVPEIRKACEADHETISQDMGDITCVRQVPAGDQFHYVITTLDSDTRCKLVIKPGPGVLDLPTSQACAKAIVDTFGPDNLPPKQ